MGAVGYRISDAQALAQDTLTHLRKRLGQDAAAYEGLLKSHAQMKRMLGQGAEHEVQQAQIAALQACADQAPFRMRVRFGKQKGAHFITMACRNRGAPPERVLEQARFSAKSFAEARSNMNEAMPSFCRILDPKAPDKKAPSPKKGWLPPPRRE